MIIPKNINPDSKKYRLRAAISEALDNAESAKKVIREVLKKKNRAINKIQQRILEDKLEKMITALEKALKEV